MRYVLFMTVVLGLACNQREPMDPPFRIAPVDEPARTDFRIVTWNIHQGYSPDPTGRQPQWDRMLDEIDKLQPTVVVMQESLSGLDTNYAREDVQHARDLSERLAGFPSFAAQMRSGTAFPHLNAYEAGLFGNSTVSLLPYEGFVSFPLSDNRTVLVTKVAGTEIANVHLTAADHDAAYREIQELLTGLALDGPTIIAGDFNAEFFDKPVQLALSAGFTSCLSVGVDHVLVSPHFECGWATWIDDDLSDHPRLVVDVRRAL